MARVTREESLRTHAEIVALAIERMAEVGFAGLRIPDVAERLGKTQGAVYGRFADKEALAVAAVRHLRDHIVLPKVVMAVSSTSSVTGALEAVSVAIADVAREHPHGPRAFARLAAETAGHDGPLAREVQSLFDVFASTLQSLVERGREAGEIRDDVEPRAFAMAVLGLPVAFSTITAMYDGSPTYADLEAALRPVLTRGVRAESAGDTDT